MNEVTCIAMAVLIRGQSLEPIIHDQQTVTAYPISCSPEVQTGDKVIFKGRVGAEPIIKLVVAVPGDTLGLDQQGQVTVNGAIVKRPSGEVWVASASGKRVLSYFKGSLNGYLVLGNVGSIDSETLGPLGTESLLATVKRP